MDDLKAAYEILGEDEESSAAPYFEAQRETLEEDTGKEPEPLVMRQYGKIEDMNRDFDIAFWQAQTTEARLQAGWELVAYYLERKGRSHELRLQRSVETFGRQRR
ncbi:MAG: hypothetical protein IT210_16085 [Armatimonadetes bacterium]|nr:hypothetical protein [Armatimonadota bacterium]